MEIETKERLSTAFEIKKLSEDGSFSGYASTFNNEDHGGDIVVPGAFKETISEWESSGDKLPILWQHSSDQPIGVISLMKEDSKGLFVEGSLVLEVEQAKEAHALLKAKAVRAMSIGYSVKTFEVDTTSYVRKLTSIKLWEISIVTFPMNEKAKITQVKDFLGSGMLPGERVFEDYLRDAGFSRTQAKTIISKGFKALLADLRDADRNDTEEEIKQSLDRLSAIIQGN